jgi:hypothetical protein
MIPTPIDSELVRESKAVIINDEKQNPFLVNLLSKDVSNKKISNGLFRYGSLSTSKRTVNLYECSEVISFNLIKPN